MRLQFPYAFILLFSLFAYQAKCQYIYFQPMEINTECYDSSTTNMEVVFRYSENISITRNNRGSHFLSFHSNDSVSSCRILNYGNDNILFDTTDITGDQAPELLIVVDSRNGHSGWQAGLSESYRHLQVYDIIHKHLILDADLKMRIETWYNELEEPDSLNSGSEPTIIESYTDIECFEMEYEISNDTIKFTPTPETETCPSSDEIQPYSLKWTNQGFIEL